MAEKTSMLLWDGCTELAGCIIAAVQGREVVIQEATGVDDDEDEEEVELSEDDELDHAEDLEDDDVGFQMNFARKPRSVRRRALIDSPDPTTEGMPHSLHQSWHIS